MILYFSGTGNSRYLAEQIAKITSDEVVSINNKLKNNDISDILVNDRLIFVVPTYAWRIPRVVREWILKTNFKGSKNTWFDLWEHLEKLVVEIAGLPFADQNRIYLMGASMGGYATWQLAMSMPRYFAAIVPICGGGMYWNAARLVNVPVWAFHGAKDAVVLLEESVKMVEAVKRSGGKAKLTVYPENGHDAWSDTYSDPNVFLWLLQHRCENGNACIDNYNRSDLYG